MNGYERIRAALSGEWPDAVPVMLHNFMMAAREAGITMAQFRRNGREIARALTEAVERYEYDGIVLDVDTVTLASAAGVPVDYPEHEPARACGARLGSLADVNTLQRVELRDSAAVQTWLEAADCLKQTFGDTVYLRGNCDQAPFSLAAMIRGTDAWLMDLLDPSRETESHKLLAFATDITSQFVTLMASTGVHMVSNGDSVSGPDMVSPSLYRRCALPYEKAVISHAHRLNLPYVLHICGDAGLILSDMVQSGADGLELDYKTDVRVAHSVMKDRTVFIGNVDPSGVLAFGSVQDVERTTRSLLEAFADTPRFILNAGCAIPAETPESNLKAFITSARTFR